MEGTNSLEPLREDAGAECKDPFDVATHEEPVDQCATPDRVTDSIHAQSAVVAFVEQVFVMPVAVGPASLFVNEPKGWFPGADLTLPAEGDAVERELVVDPNPGPHRNGSRVQDAEP